MQFFVRLLWQLESLNAMQLTNGGDGLSPKKEEEKGDEGKTRSFDPSSSEERGKN